MAAILKLPSADAPGVISITTPERDNVIKPSPELRATLQDLRGSWLVGLHHNWHDHAFVHDPLFDFSFAGKDDLREVTGKSFPVLGLDACNFTPEVFAPGGTPFWDVLFVARAVYFKRIPKFFQTIRTLYDRGHVLRVLLLSPIPPHDPADEKTVFHGIRLEYERMFDSHEREFFTLLTMDWDYPFPLDLPTLAHFYRSARVFVHTAADERRCRVAAYAWATGLPVVGPEPIGSLLPHALRREPWFFEASRDRDLPRRVLEALEAAPLAGSDLDAVRAEVASDSTRRRLVDRLAEIAVSRGFGWNNDALALDRLDIRLGRHHGLGVPGPNRVEPGLAELLDAIVRRPQDVADAAKQGDLERMLEQSIVSPSHSARKIRRLAR